MDEERVVAAAIKFFLSDGKTILSDPMIICGRRHSNIFEAMFSLGLRYDKPSHTQGFWTNQNRFVDRYEAFEIAKAANQILPEAQQEVEKSHTLYSEDVW